MLSDKLDIASMTDKNTGKMPDIIEIAIGMKAMVMLNIATESDLANGTCGTIEDIILDPQEHNPTLDEDNIVDLQYPPALIIFRPFQGENTPTFEGLSHGLLLIVPTEVSFLVKKKHRPSYTIYRHQIALTTAYSFTHHKAQGQGLDYLIVDLADPPKHVLDSFHAYVALSHSKGRETIRIL
ncbi:hypothetical protein IW261DRAFT_1566977 [Armillaria novae-zelandiae]|uniref:ATP-dependent DNA helicase n=1 Tax=Armillaria novae-zelandiae TaxID=153914 RepID=A0AA39P2D9_9AGAR|nr:hypothetical protein IW261DRAFT_1566977 [Armillaria novae-zelandiae]